MGTSRYLVGDVFDRLAELPDDSVDLCFCSPPFLALRSYLPPDHPDKGREIGSEATPADFVDALLDVVEALDRVLAPHGTLCVELGDTYAGSGGGGGDYLPGGMRDGQPGFAGAGMTQREGNALDWRNKQRAKSAWPEAKSLCGIPAAFELSLAYGFNVLRDPDDPRGPRRTPRWRVRNLCPWVRPNPPVGALGDKFRPATSYVIVACKSPKRYFDMEAVRTEPVSPPQRFLTPHGGGAVNAEGERVAMSWGDGDVTNRCSPGGAPPLDWLNIPTQPYKGSHYATFPTALVTPFVRAMSPQRVCRTCGKPSERITETTNAVGSRPVGAATGKGAARNAVRDGEGEIGTRHWDMNGAPDYAEVETLGWTDCGHDDWRPGLVLDPFAGSGTTLEVATGEGRDAVGIDIDSRNAWLARERVGMFLTVEDGATDIGAE